MKIEISRRKFLQGTTALCVATASSMSLAQSNENQEKQRLQTTKTNQENNIKKIPTLCEMCVNKCALYARVENGTITKLDPNPYFPKSQNMLCARGNAGIQAVYDPDRLKYPLVRNGKRGDGQYKRVTWDEAYQYIEEKMSKILDEEKDNRSCFGYCSGEGMAEHTFKTFMRDKIGSSNFVNHASICLQTTVSGYALTIGGYGQADLENARYIIMAGANRAEAIVTPDTMDLFKRTKKRGAKLIVIDPRFSNTAAHSDKWLPIEVGTDLAFVLALTYVVIKEELYNKKFVELNVNNFDEYKEHILSSKYTPKWAEELTGIKAKDIEEIARDFMKYAPRAIYYQGRRTAWSMQDFQLRRAQAIFTALGGGIDKEGGIIFGKKLPLSSHEINAPMYSNAQSRIEKDAASIIGGSGSWIAWRNKIIEDKAAYNIRGMFVYKQNPMLSVPDIKKTRKMFEKMDLVVVIDTMPSDTALLADVILPECTYLEREDPIKSFGGTQPSIALRQAVIKPMYETKPVIEILSGLGEKLSKPLFEISRKYDEDLQEELEGLTEKEVKAYYFENGYDLAHEYKHTQEEINHHMMHGMYGEEAWNELREKGVYYKNMQSYFKKININEYEWYPKHKRYYSVVEGEFKSDVFHDTCVNEKEIAVLKKEFKTPTGKVECVLSNLEKKGVDAMPLWRDELYTKTPKGQFKFITGRHGQFTQNATSNNAMLLDLMPENYLWINKRIAKEKEIAFGDLVEVKSEVGSIHIKAYPTEKIGMNTLFFVHGFGAQSQDLNLAYGNGGADNMIIKDAIEPVFGSAAMHETIVNVRKV